MIITDRMVFGPCSHKTCFFSVLRPDFATSFVRYSASYAMKGRLLDVAPGHMYYRPNEYGSHQTNVKFKYSNGCFDDDILFQSILM